MRKERSNKVTGEQVVQADQGAKEPEQAEEPIDEGAEINRLLDEGYSVKQIIELGFKRRTAYHYAKLRMQPENDPSGSSQGDGPPGGQANKGRSESSRDGALAIRKEKESVLPEWLERDVAEIFDGQTRDQRIFMAGISVPLLGLRLFGEAVKPLTELMSVWQKGQAEAARAAQGSGIEMAQAAGEAAAGGIARWFMEAKPWVSAAPDPWQAMMVDTTRPIIQQLLGQIMSKFTQLTPQGQLGAQPLPGAQATFQPPQSGQPGFEQPSGVPQATEEEIEEAFND